MIDMHNHVLSNLDDGPNTDELAVELIEQAISEGITGIVATPHHLHPNFSNNINAIKSKVFDLQTILKQKELDIDLYYGQEIRITDQILTEIDENKITGINGSNYLLIEFPSNEVPVYTNKLFYELQTMGYIPIIAHPERNKAIAQNLDVLFELVNGGALAQLTSGSLAGVSGKNIKKLSLKMIENNLVHFVASDAHSVSQRPFLMNGLFQEKSLKNYKDELNSYFENANRLIKNEKVIKGRPSKDYKQKKWFGIF
ncbi:capsular biosynthesis protein [Staphylococcus gallinarum]|uniref:tyrosine-protein phosphatase n=1 Tax=Staphylococcus gallinarum TaxID=1293 RepID=UPI001E4C940C|nr:CpsB/CapC family capsule biosynthesis tyrosine phosphatase [Staphylococcus gallinarum]MCD8843905.1 capsular biosynthesis protein [Staphylococcus gallinarum]MCD8909785.1 capsular biosynthesis protein [Staphylococcus gallinarum]